MPVTGRRGRPSVEISRDQLTVLRDQGFTAVQMARQLGCSAALIYKRLAFENLNMQKRFSNFSDSDIDERVKAIHTAHGNAGNQVCCCIHFSTHLRF
jgi:hypothetical protein